MVTKAAGCLKNPPTNYRCTLVEFFSVFSLGLLAKNCKIVKNMTCPKTGANVVWIEVVLGEFLL